MEPAEIGSEDEAIRSPSDKEIQSPQNEETGSQDEATRDKEIQSPQNEEIGSQDESTRSAKHELPFNQEKLNTAVVNPISPALVSLIFKNELKEPILKITVLGHIHTWTDIGELLFLHYLRS